MTDQAPPLDYTATSFFSMRDVMDRLAQQKCGAHWTDFNANNPGAVLFDAMAQVGDLLIFMLNAHLRECFVSTLTRESSFYNVAKPFGFSLRPPSQATALVQITSDPALLPYTLSPTAFAVSDGAATSKVIFTPLAPTLIQSAKQNVQFVEGSRVIGEVLGQSDASALQRFALATPSPVLQTLQVFVGGVLWGRADAYTDMLPADQKYLCEPAEGDVVYVKFGDGQNGAVPADTLSITANYTAGGGARGNVAQGALSHIETPQPSILSVQNLGPADGGQDGMSIVEAQKALPAFIKTLGRAIAYGDYQALALEVPGVKKAIEVIGSRTQKTILLPIAPAGGGAPSAVLKNQVRQFFADKKELVTEVVPTDPFYLPLRVELDLHVRDNFRQAEVLSAVTTRLLDMLNVDSLGFGETVRLQTLYDALSPSVAGLQGVAFVQISTLSALSQPRLALGQSNTGNGALVLLDSPPSTLLASYALRVVATSPYPSFTVTTTLGGASTDLSQNVLTDAAARYVPGALVGYSLQPDAAASQRFVIVANDVTSLTVGAGADLTQSAAVGRPYAVSLTSEQLGKVLHTTTSQAAPAGQASVFVQNTVGFAPGDRVLFAQGTAQQTVGVVQSVVAGASLTLTAPLVTGLPQGAAVDAAYQSDDGLANFALCQGGVAFVAQDSLFFDRYPPLADVCPRAVDIPYLLPQNLAIRAIGGL